jgi:septum formation protein
MRKNLVLASSSKYRKTLLEKVFKDVHSIAPAIDERATRKSTPHELAIELGTQKAKSVASMLKGNNLIIGSDQVAILDGHQLHKPGNAENNIKQLASCSGKRVRFFTSVCLHDPEENTLRCDVDETIVTFKQLSEQDIQQYVSREPSYDCAGGFKVEGLGISLFESIETSDPNALVGLPLIKLCKLLGEYGISPLD